MWGIPGNSANVRPHAQSRAELEPLSRGCLVSPDGSSLPRQRCARMRPPNSVLLSGRLRRWIGNDPTRHETTAADRQSSFHATPPSREAHTAQVQAAAQQVLVEQDEYAPESTISRLSSEFELVRCLWHQTLNQPIPPVADAQPNSSQHRAKTRTRSGHIPETPIQGHPS